MKPAPRQTWNRPPLRSLQPAKPQGAQQTESWWINLSREQFQAECERRHPSGKNETYRRIA